MTAATAEQDPPKDTEANDRLREFLYQMMLIRRFEERTGQAYTQGKVRGFLHLYIGEEACAVGAINALSSQDKIVTHYRDHGHALARGLDPNRIMAELFGREDGLSHGRGGSMHLFDASKGFLGGYAIVSGHMPIATGLALAGQMKGTNSVTMCIFGDGGVGEGEFHESLNLAALWKLPVIWFCENNGYGMGVPLKDSIANDIYRIAAAYNIPSVQVDGMDVAAVYTATVKAVEHCRAGPGPYFIEALTYRYRGHSMADPELYRSKAEVDEFRKRDAIERVKTNLMSASALNEAGFAELEARVESVVDTALAFAEASPQPQLSSLYDNILDEAIS